MANPLFDTLFAVHRTSDRPFLIPPTGPTIAYSAFLDRASQMAGALTAAGLRAGDRVAVQVAKSPDALALYAASVQAGLVFLPLNTGYTGAELRYFIEDSGAGLLIADPATPGLSALAPQHLTLDRDGAGTLATLAAAQSKTFETVPRRTTDLAALLYTSGTTGRSKGAMLSQGNLLSNAETLAQAWRFSASDTLLHALPIFHTHGLFVATNITLIAGGAMIFLPKFDLDPVFATLPRATAMMGVPTFYTRLLGDARLSKAAVAHMRLFVSGSAPLLAETHARFEAATGHRILERYGMTETNMNASNPYDGPRRPGTVGRPLPGVEIQITEDDTPLPVGTVGQIEVRGPNVFQGYWQMPEKTAAELRETGFFKTGDLGLIDAQGYLSIVGRSKDLIISGGYNIYPKEVELVLDAEPGVLESAVIGVPHPDFGEAVVGVLVPEPGAEPDLTAVMRACDGALARYKHPKRLVLRDALPRNAMGKVQKNLLRDAYADMFAMG